MPRGRAVLWLLARIPLYLLAAVYVILIGMALHSDRIIFQPPHPADYEPGREILQLRSADGTPIAATYLSNPEARYTLLFSHGNAEDLGGVRPLLELLRSAGFAVFAYDYPGYGLSGGAPSEAGTYRAEDAAYDYLVNQLHVPPERIIVFGRSVGSGPAVEIASRRPAAGLVVESGFTSAFRVLTRVRLLPWDKFNNLARIRNVHCPVLVIHGMRDRVIPFHHGETLFANANEPKFHYWVEQADHNDVAYTAGEAYLQTLRSFATTLDVPPR